MSANPAAARVEAPPWLATVMLAKDDTEESVMGTHLHQRAIILAYGALSGYAPRWGRRRRRRGTSARRRR